MLPTSHIPTECDIENHPQLPEILIQVTSPSKQRSRLPPRIRIGITSQWPCLPLWDFVPGKEEHPDELRGPFNGIYTTALIIEVDSKRIVTRIINLTPSNPSLSAMTAFGGGIVWTQLQLAEHLAAVIVKGRAGAVAVGPERGGVVIFAVCLLNHIDFTHFIAAGGVIVCVSEKPYLFFISSSFSLSKIAMEKWTNTTLATSRKYHLAYARHL
jgi:hypothetical protein